MDPILIDGSRGEGGGQVLRTSLALSLATGKPFRIHSIRARRKRPGLQRQHLTAVSAARDVGRAEARGAALGSRELTFIPRGARAGEYAFSIGTAGSTTLVLQTLLPALLRAGEPSIVRVEGGTHNPMAPPFDFLEKSYLPLLERMGARVDLRLERPGFYPAGGGRLRARVEPAGKLSPLGLRERGALRRRRARALIARLPRHVGERELAVVRRALGWPAECLEVEEVEDAAGPGNALLLEVESETVTEVFTSFGKRGVRAEAVAREAIDECRRYLASQAPAGEHLADQLLLPLALAGGGTFRAVTVSGHARSNIDVIREFLEVEFRVEELSEDLWEVEVEGR